MKGLILCGGAGTRLAPLTALTNKHLLPVGMRFMVEYPLQTIIQAGIDEIMIVTGAEFCGDFARLLGSGREYGCRLQYAIQDRQADVAGGYGGIGQAITLAEDYGAQGGLMVMLGDNILGCDISSLVNRWEGRGAMSFFVDVKTKERARQFGIGRFDSDGRLVSVLEKPDDPPSTMAQIGVYLFDNCVFSIIDRLKPSARGQMEVTDIINEYLMLGCLDYAIIPGPWTDAGTPETYRAACEQAWKDTFRDGV